MLLLLNDACKQIVLIPCTHRRIVAPLSYICLISLKKQISRIRCVGLIVNRFTPMAGLEKNQLCKIYKKKMVSQGHKCNFLFLISIYSMVKNMIKRKNNYICTADYDLCHLNAEKHLTFHCHNITFCYFCVQVMKGVLINTLVTIIVLPAFAVKEMVNGAVFDQRIAHIAIHWPSK